MAAILGRRSRSEARQIAELLFVGGVVQTCLQLHACFCTSADCGEVGPAERNAEGSRMQQHATRAI